MPARCTCKPPYMSPAACCEQALSRADAPQRSRALLPGVLPPVAQCAGCCLFRYCCHFAQAWGLLELQRGNVLAAVILLERCVANDPRCSPVLRCAPN